jgi:hypothetical protein
MGVEPDRKVERVEPSSTVEVKHEDKELNTGEFRSCKREEGTEGEVHAER